MRTITPLTIIEHAGYESLGSNMMKVQSQFKTKAIAEQYMKERGWYRVTFANYLLNSRLPGQRRLIVSVASHWEIKAGSKGYRNDLHRLLSQPKSWFKP